MNLEQVQPTVSANLKDRQESILGQGVIWFLLIANIFDMGGAFGIKYVSFAVALLYLLNNYRSLPLEGPICYLFIFTFLTWPVLALLNGIVSGSEITLAVSQITPFFAAIAFFLVLQSVNPQQALSAFFSTMFILAIIVCVLYGLLWSNHPAGTYLLSILQSSEHGYFGFRPIKDDFIPSVYFKATLFLVPTYVYFLYRNRIVKALLVLLAVVLAFSKSGFVICMLFTLGYIFLYQTERRFKIATTAFLILVSPWFFSFGLFSEELIKSLTGQSETSQIRLAYLAPLNTLFMENPLVILVGQGAGSLFYTGSDIGLVSNIEIDHLNAIRKFGLPWFLVFTAFVLRISYKLFISNISEGRIIGLALLAMFVAAGTNPVLISPPFLMFMMMALDFYWRKNEPVC
jgi:hypothetical protein